MDIKCVRLVPYEINGSVYVDIQQVIPLPEAGDYQIRIRQKEAARERSIHADGRDFTKYHIVANGNDMPATNKRHSVRMMITSMVEAGVPIESIRDRLPPSVMQRLPGPSRPERNSQKPCVRPTRNWTSRPGSPSTRSNDDAADATYVLIKKWARQTEATLTLLSDAFPNSGVTFRTADPD